jgi:hypothetical protein
VCHNVIFRLFEILFSIWNMTRDTEVTPPGKISSLIRIDGISFVSMLKNFGGSVQVRKWIAVVFTE